MAQAALAMDMLDGSQLRALHACRPHSRVSIVGAPGTGKTSVLAALVQRIVAAENGQRVAVLTQDRRAASALRSALSLALGGLPETIEVRSLAAFSYSIVQAYAQAVGRRSPELISGPEEDTILAEILAMTDVEIEYPSFAQGEARMMPEFRAQVRDLITRAQELGYGPDDLEELGVRHSEPMWIAGAHILRLYRELNETHDALSGRSDSPDRLDHAQLVATAASVLHAWEEFVNSSPHHQSREVARPHWDWILVDDIQNSPRSILALLSELGDTGAALVVAGSPDSAVQGFRGGISALPGIVGRPAPEGLGCEIVSLTTRHRGGHEIATLADTLTNFIRVSGEVASHREPQAGESDDAVGAYAFIHDEEQLGAIARYIRERHLRTGEPYSQFAIITRSRAAHTDMRSFLVRRGVPVAQIGSDIPLRDRNSVASLLGLVKCALAKELGESTGSVAPGDVGAVLTSMIVGIDPIDLVRSGRALRAYELIRGGQRLEEELLCVVLEGAEAVREIAPRGADKLVEVARIIEKIRRAYRVHHGQAEHVLWAAWDASGKADEWQRLALAGGNSGDDADEALDSIIQLFRVAQRMSDRDPDIHILEFLHEIESQDLPEDSIARAGALGDYVTLTTPAASQGYEWNHVIVASFDDGTWPNLQIRDTYTHTGKLANIAAGRHVAGIDLVEEQREAVNDILDDELRQFHHAITRARTSVVLTCVRGNGHAPSRFFAALGFTPVSTIDELREAYTGREADEYHALAKNLHGIALEPHVGASGAQSPRRAEPGPSDDRPDELAPSRILWAIDSLYSDLSLASIIGKLRQALGGEDSREAQDLLLRLQAAGVREADPHVWVDSPMIAAQPESEAMRVVGNPYLGSGRIAVSPSRVESLLACPLRGVLSVLGAERTDGHKAADLGTLIHAIAQEFPHGPRASMLAMLDEEWGKTMPSPDSSVIAARDYAETKKKVETLATYIESQKDSHIEVEQGVRVEVGSDILVTARLDRLLIDEGVRIADFKTGKNATLSKAEAEDNVQMQVYQWAVERSGIGESRGAELVYVGKALASGMPTIREQRPLTESTRERAHTRIVNAAAILSMRELPANPDDNRCRHCQFAIVCPAVSQGRLFS
ncbi:ATP-dependent helicase [Arcanobacterium haemolyticum]|nr:ATP-dependent helicase [Arcanobacterium haemolyticum]